MNNRKKWWLIVRAILIVLFLASVFLSPSKDNFQLFSRSIMIAVLGITFIMDLYQYSKDKKNKS
jgi:phosphatidylglycerophosphate synthase